MDSIPKLKVLIVGYGDLGSAIADQLTHLNMHVYGVARSYRATDSAEMIQADVTELASLHRLRDIQPDMIVYCIAASGQTDAQYKQAYVDGLRNVLMTQTDNRQLKHVFFVSSTRVYGQVTDDILGESVTPLPVDFGGERLLEAESLLGELPCNTTVLRLSGIYGPGRLRMINLAKAPERWPKNNSWSNRIHRDDAAAFMTFLIQKVLLGKEKIKPCYIVTDATPVSQYEVLTWIALQLALEVPESMPVSGGKRLSNQAMLATGFVPKYPDYRVGYQAILRELAIE
ncbi:NAD-dependent epimerase/dehydratase family protein [Methylotenera sp. L2L1]|uniref:NAD-dependent epimerase/dehydratase family protein n=1 Tax=Methylotenera sp. L2L1 TaxID=1502770 RepID=UPI000567BBF0|nr:NAD-dependent epimerase/dehydratase family protein [Methylotenera sp. L2L1]